MRKSGPLQGSIDAAWNHDGRTLKKLAVMLVAELEEHTSTKENNDE